ncbi:MAG: 16S rRNA (cytidine(1402)-2'-O)-methyltransferase [Armatimonadota bacterium]|nr:16S rRNA (cytidine(1402)-2'-O)-methyltransferase [Armatimonadota bacterium]
MRATGRLYIIGTPIGNLEDLTFRAKRLLGEVDALACEDTRHTGLLLARHGISRPPLLFSYHEHNEERAAERVLSLLSEGRAVGLCSNAGYPGISDPGYVILSKATAAGYPVEVIPGASAPPVALLLSGLPTSSYTFKGFPPRKSGPRRTFVAMEKELPHTLVFFEAPQRLGAFLADALHVLGDRRAAVCVELTKKFEETHRGYLSDLVERFRGVKVKGEVTVVIAGNHPRFQRASPSRPQATALPNAPIAPASGAETPGEADGR